ncbi:hypothetical protein OF83DRAFT_1085692 [Amylostereum chailletii]|nr:hypothetical protein OF83DRAFT_1085692 [Amylostereum chailletii]
MATTVEDGKSGSSVSSVDHITHPERQVFYFRSVRSTIEGSLGHEIDIVAHWKDLYERRTQELKEMTALRDEKQQHMELIKQMLLAQTSNLDKEKARASNMERSLKGRIQELEQQLDATTELTALREFLPSDGGITDMDVTRMLTDLNYETIQVSAILSDAYADKVVSHIDNNLSISSRETLGSRVNRGLEPDTKTASRAVNAKIGHRLAEVVRLAFDLNENIARYRGVHDIHPVEHPSYDDYDLEIMENAYSPGTWSEPPGMQRRKRVLCTTEIGLMRVKEKERKLIVKPKVVILDTLLPQATTKEQ